MAITYFYKNTIFMKKYLFIIYVISSMSAVNGQEIPSIGMKDEFNIISKFTRTQSGFEGIQTYSSGEVRGSQFFYPTWAPGSINTGYKISSDKYLFLFDKVRQQVFIKVKDSNLVLLADRNQIISFTLNTDRQHVFVAAANYAPDKKDQFYEVLAINESGYTLLKQVKTKFAKADTRDMEKMKMGDMSDEFKDEISYFVSYKNGLVQKVDLREKSIKKAYGSSSKNVLEEYFKTHSDASIDEQFLIDFTHAVNKG